jgi:hypothetical protein
MHALPSNIFTNAKYQYVKVANYKVIFWSLTIGFGKFVKKLDVLSIEEEHKMLAQTMCQPMSPSSLNF